MHTPHPAKNRQHGAVLVVSLLVLLVLTLIGISSLDGSVMEEKMAANAQTAAATFQKAESAIKQTYYVQSLNPAQSVSNAQAGNTATYPVDGNISSSTQMVYPVTTVKTPIFNSSAGFVAHRIEIVGNANAGVNGIRSQNIQGYRVFPMMAAP